MYKYHHRKHLVGAARAAGALCAIAALSGQAAQAQVSFITQYSQLTSPIKTDQYPQGPTDGSSFIVPSTFTVADGKTNSLTFTATNGTAGGGFVSDLANPAIGPQFSDPAFGGAPNDVVEDTTFASTAQNTATAPLLIQFQNPVSGFGLLAQDFNADKETFTLNVFADANATVSLGSFTYAQTDNTSSAGTAVFVGALTAAGLPVIRSATLSSFSVATGPNPNNGSNDFFFGPTQVNAPAPIPEASTAVGIGMGVLLFGGLALVTRKRQHGAAS